MDQLGDVEPIGDELSVGDGAQGGENEHGEATREVYGELQHAFDFFNERLFDNTIPRCLITLQRERRTKGYFSPRRFVRLTGQVIDEIAMNPSYFASDTIEGNLSTLVHEMVHAWQRHHGKSGRRGYHNTEWAAKMKDVGLMPSDTGKPGGRQVGERMDHYIVRGGPFELAAQELVTTEFKLSWMDRFVSEAPRTFVGETHVDGAGGENGSTPAGDSPDDPFAPWASLEDAEEPAESPAADDAEPTASPVASLPAAVRGELVTAQGTVNRSNRAKYRCPECALQVWGKPGVRVLCGQDSCATPVMEVVGAPAPAPAPEPAVTEEEA